MRKVTCFIAGMLVAGLIGCQNSKTRTGEGAAIGGVLGALAGGIIGHNDDRHAGEGLAIGAAVGAVTGAVVGSQIEKQPPQQAAAVQPEQAPAYQSSVSKNANQMSLPQIAELIKQGVHEDVIIDRLRLAHARYVLSEQDIAYLKGNGVSQKVISAMQAG